MREDLLILGCGYTGQRVAQRFLQRGVRVTAVSRDPNRLAHLPIEVITPGQLRNHTSSGMLVLHSIPPDGPPGLLEALAGKAARVVYISSTAVYGRAELVNESTAVDIDSERAQARVAVEREIAGGPWSWLILRPAAIYGPGRGVQESIQRGEHSMSDSYVSRIHVDDLAALCEAALLSDLRGFYPVADDEPCTSREIAEFCAALLNLPLKGGAVPARRVPRFSHNRKVDGSAIRRLLGVKLMYPSYKTGVPASLKG